MIQVDGRALAEKIRSEVAEAVSTLPTPPRLTVFTCAPNFETQKFLALKKRHAEAVGISLRIVEFSSEATTPEILLSIQAAHHTSDGIIVQLPFPAHIAIDEVLPAIAPSHDVDALTYDGTSTTILPPVVGAIDEICKAYRVSLREKRVVIVGHGRLVGVPAAIYARRQGADVVVLTKESSTDMAEALACAEVLVLGAGVPGLITAAHLSPGVVIFDAGTSEAAGKLTGDADPSVAEKASLVTPVPGGIGPITVAVLLRNVVRLTMAVDKTT